MELRKICSADSTGTKRLSCRVLSKSQRVDAFRLVLDNRTKTRQQNAEGFLRCYNSTYDSYSSVVMPATEQEAAGE